MINNLIHNWEVVLAFICLYNLIGGCIFLVSDQVLDGVGIEQLTKRQQDITIMVLMPLVVFFIGIYILFIKLIKKV